MFGMQNMTSALKWIKLQETTIPQFTIGCITNYFISRLAADGLPTKDLNSHAYPLYEAGHIQSSPRKPITTWLSAYAYLRWKRISYIRLTLWWTVMVRLYLPRVAVLLVSAQQQVVNIFLHYVMLWKSFVASRNSVRSVHARLNGISQGRENLTHALLMK